MDQGTSAEQVEQAGAGGRRSAARRNAASYNGLAPQVAAVEAARARLGRDLDQLDVEVRAQMSETMEKAAWKAAATAAAIIAGIAARKVLMSSWRKMRRSEPPANPAGYDTTWPEALVWAAATGIGVGIARMIATRGAAEGWRRYKGVLPPGLQDVM